jgi:hypothetical protein
LLCDRWIIHILSLADGLALDPKIICDLSGLTRLVAHAVPRIKNVRLGFRHVKPESPACRQAERLLPRICPWLY